MIENNNNIKIKGFVFKKFPIGLKVFFVCSVIVHILFIVFQFLGNENIGNAIFSAEMLLLIIFWIIYCYTQKKELKVEDGVLYFNNEEIRVKGYKVEYNYGNKIYLKTEDEKFLFYAHSRIKPTKSDRIYLREKVIALENYLKNEKIPIEHNFEVSGTKIVVAFLGILILLPLITAIIQSILKIFIR